jgi:UDP-glucose 4-epimerase
MTAAAWVIGSGGLLGGALTRAARSRGWSVLAAGSLPWGNEKALSAAVSAEMESLFALSVDGDWRVLWAAGTAVTSSPDDVFAVELRQFRIVLDGIEAAISKSAPSGRGSFFYSSSAGGVYSGSADPPFTEQTAPRPISLYGKFKLESEAVLDVFSRASGVSVLKGRIANLYGPGQRLDKAQGLISHIARAQLSPTPASIYVSLDTMRDYLFVDDCAQLICDGVDKLVQESRDAAPIQVLKNLCSGSGVTIATILGYFRTLAKGHPHVMLGSSAASTLQARDLRIASTVWADLDRRELTPMPAGIHATLDDLRRAQQMSRTGP